MMLTGHKSESSFLRYIKVSGEDNAKDVARKLKKDRVVIKPNINYFVTAIIGCDYPKYTKP